MKWTLEQLRTFVEVADAGSMTGAARALGYTTGAVSQQMQALSGATGRTLFVRDGRAIELSDDGRTLLEQARLVLDAERRAQRVLTHPQGPVGATVDLGVFGSAAVASILPTSKRLRQTLPELTLRTREVDVEHMPQAVADRALDLALGLTYPGSPSALPRGVTVVPLRREPFLVVLPPVLAAARTADEVQHAANSSEWILPPADSEFGRAARLACDAAGIEPRIAHIVTDTAVSLAMAESGLGLTLATPLMLRMSPRTLATAPLPVPADREIVAIVRRGSLERASVRGVLAALREVFDTTGAAAIDAFGA